MAKSFSVRVMGSNGKARQSVSVGAHFGLWGVASAYTDSDGWATLNFPTDASPEMVGATADTL